MQSNSLVQPRMVSLVKNSTKKGAKIQNEYIFLLRCIMATSWIQNLYFKGQLFLKCPFDVFKSPKQPTKKFLGFLP